MKGKLSIKRVILIVVVVISILLGGMFLWMSNSYDYRECAEVALQESDDLNVIESNDYIEFKLNGVNMEKGFIFYPGAKVEPGSYAPLCRKIAKNGYKVIIVKMPLNFAIFDKNKAKNIIDENSDISTWIIGGHSLGGVMASDYALEDDRIKGVVLYASYPQGENLKTTDKKILSIWGSNDGVADLNKVKNASFPDDAHLVEIQGGNHAGFGDYGEQSGDNEATISGKEQIEKASEVTCEFLKNI
ncbi:MAG: alpha/beta hydrolase [Clostridiaceae bacterium]|nr:alpha/beta hydrolase [Clostridiaceae bacterium]